MPTGSWHRYISGGSLRRIHDNDFGCVARLADRGKNRIGIRVSGLDLDAMRRQVDLHAGKGIDSRHRLFDGSCAVAARHVIDLNG